MKWKLFFALLVLCEGNLTEGLDKRTASNRAIVTFYKVNIVNFLHFLTVLNYIIKSPNNEDVILMPLKCSILKRDHFY